MTRLFERGLLPLDEAKHARFKYASEYGFSFPEPTYPIDRSAGLTDFGMGGNGPDPTLTVNDGKPVGDCGPNAVPKNANMIDAVLAGLELSAYKMTSDQIVDLYFEFTGGQDTGVDLGDWLLWLFKKGLIKAFVKLQLKELDAALAMGLAVVVGVNLNPQADEQFPNGWTVGPGDEPDPEDGHAILYAVAESIEGPFKWVSWGGLATSDLPWKEQCPQQAFGVVTDPDVLEKNGFPVAALIADLTDLGGTVAPTEASATAVVGDTGRLLSEVFHAIEETPRHIVDSLKISHELQERIVENASIEIISAIIKDLVHTYMRTA